LFKLSSILIAKTSVFCYHEGMRKIIFSFVFLLLAGIVFAQNYTFQDIPWGSTKEQVIAKLGEPKSITNNSPSYFINMRLIYFVNINGYNANLNIRFHESKMYDAFYAINNPPFRDLDEVQLNIAFLVLLKQLTDKYGAFHEVFTQQSDNEAQCWVWHFNNFHIYISSIVFNTFEIGYRSNDSWKVLEKEWLRNMVKLPNRGL